VLGTLIHKVKPWKLEEWYSVDSVRNDSVQCLLHFHNANLLPVRMFLHLSPQLRHEHPIVKWWLHPYNLYPHLPQHLHHVKKQPFSVDALNLQQCIALNDWNLHWRCHLSLHRRRLRRHPFHDPHLPLLHHRHPTPLLLLARIATRPLNRYLFIFINTSKKTCHQNKLCDNRDNLVVCWF